MYFEKNAAGKMNFLLLETLKTRSLLLADFLVSVFNLTALLIRCGRGERFITCCVINQRTLRCEGGCWMDLELTHLIRNGDDCLYLIEPNLAIRTQKITFNNKNYLNLHALTIPFALIRRVSLKLRNSGRWSEIFKGKELSSVIQVAIYSFILKRVGVQEVYLKAYYNPSKVPLCAAALRLGITLNEVQHSYIYSGHIGYLKDSIYCCGQEVRPDLLWLNAAANFNYLSLQGHLLASQYPPTRHRTPTICPDKKYDAIVVCQHNNVDFYVRIARHLNKQYSVAVKLHPMHEIMQEAEFARSGLRDGLILSGAMDFKSCLDLTDIFIGEFSSGLVLAIDEGKLVIVVGEQGREKLAEFMGLKNSIYCEESELPWTLKQSLKNCF